MLEFLLGYMVGSGSSSAGNGTEIPLPLVVRLMANLTWVLSIIFFVLLLLNAPASACVDQSAFGAPDLMYSLCTDRTFFLIFTGSGIVLIPALGYVLLRILRATEG